VDRILLRVVARVRPQPFTVAPVLAPARDQVEQLLKAVVGLGVVVAVHIHLRPGDSPGLTDHCTAPGPSP